MFNEFCKEAHENAKAKGFWDNSTEIGTKLMLIVSELGEALEADRNRKRAYLRRYLETDMTPADFELFIKDSFEDEIADAFIRLGDLCGGLGIDIDSFIREKKRYNKTRPHKHGKTY